MLLMLTATTGFLLSSRRREQHPKSDQQHQNATDPLHHRDHLLIFMVVIPGERVLGQVHNQGNDQQGR